MGGECCELPADAGYDLPSAGVGAAKGLAPRFGGTSPLSDSREDVQLRLRLLVHSAKTAAADIEAHRECIHEHSVFLDIQTPHVVRAALRMADVVPELRGASTDLAFVGHERILLESFSTVRHMIP